MLRIAMIQLSLASCLCIPVSSASAAGAFAPPLLAAALTADDLTPHPFGHAFPNLDGWTTGTWWQSQEATGPTSQRRKSGGQKAKPFDLDVSRSDVIAFAIYTVTVRPEARGTLKLSAQLFPLTPRKIVVLLVRSEGLRHVPAMALRAALKGTC